MLCNGLRFNKASGFHLGLYSIPHMIRAGFNSVLLLSALLFVLSGCVNVGAMMADVLSNSVLNQRDPKTVQEGLPAYLLLLDGMILEDPDEVETLLAGARLYSAYSGVFVDDPARSRLMSETALKYARQALCLEFEELCAALSQPLDEFRVALNEYDDTDDLKIIYGYASVWAGWIQSNSSDWQAIADLPKVEAMMRRVLTLDESYEQGNAHLYMGVLLTLRPASLGGQPELGKEHFQQAMKSSGGHNLMTKVLYARHYARLVFDQELHDRLLKEVLASSVEYPDLTLMNVLAQRQAEALLASSNDYF